MTEKRNRSRALLSLGFFVGLALGAGSLGCRGAADKSGAEEARKLAPLQAQALVWPEGVQLDVPRGATTPRELLLLWLSECPRRETLPESVGFVLCVSSQLSAAEREKHTQDSLKLMKSHYGEYLLASSVDFVADASSSAAALELLLREPSFFQRAALQLGENQELSSIQLHAYGQRGGKRLLLLQEESPRAERLRSSSRSLSLEFKQLPVHAPWPEVVQELTREFGGPTLGK